MVSKVEKQSVLKPDLKILIIDDVATMRKVMRKLLKEIGLCNVEEAENGERAWTMLNEKPYDLVISDWNMPKLKGIELVQKIRADEKLKAIPFLMVTSNNSREHVTEAAGKGVGCYLTKPFDVDKLRQMVSLVLRG